MTEMLDKEIRTKAYEKLCKLNRRHKDVCRWLRHADGLVEIDAIVEKAVELFPECKAVKEKPVRQRLEEKRAKGREKKGLKPKPIVWHDSARHHL
jgi:hypothetical protein|tara:strand:- start:55 stop:339 length:285 start_codon:yes stop_codon:yes gene_type:complete